MDSKYADMQSFKFETLLRQIVSQCTKPVRDRVMNNNEQISALLSEHEAHKEKIKLLEIIYKNKLDSEDPESGVVKPITVFDTINNKIADNAIFCREREQALQGQINIIKNMQDELVQSIEVQKKTTETTTRNVDIFTEEISKLQLFCNQFKQETNQRLNISDTDTKAQIQTIMASLRSQIEEVNQIKLDNEVTRETDQKQDRMIEHINAEINKINEACERLKMTKQDASEFKELRIDVLAKVNRSMAQVQDVNSKIEATDNYLARYLPFNQFIQMLEVSKVVVPDILTNKKLREHVENYEYVKTRALYQHILFDDGKAPKHFAKDFLLVGRDQINDLLGKNANLTSKNVRSVKSGYLSIKRHEEHKAKERQMKVNRDMTYAISNKMRESQGKKGLTHQ